MTIAAAEMADAQVQGGLVKALIAARLEILRTSEALVWQRIHAVESGAPVVLQVPITQSDPNRAAELQQEISNQEKTLSFLRTDAARYVGGLVHSLKLTAVATQEQTIALLQQNMLTAKYGLAIAPSTTGRGGTVETAAKPPKSEISNTGDLIAVTLMGKKLADHHVLSLDLEFTSVGLEKPSRAVKGSLKLNDLFGETRLRIGWTIDKPLIPRGSVRSYGLGFQYNQFMPDHQWVERTPITDIVAIFEVVHILFQDGSRRDF
jgi:hypothetical protein